MQRYGAVKAISGNDIATVQSQLEDVDGVIISYHTSAASPYKKAVLSKNDIALIQAIAQKHPVYLNFFTKPYILNALEAQTKDMAVMVSYQNTAIAQQISADIMWGATAAEGSLPVTASKEYPVGTGISLAAQQRLGYSTPALQGFDTKKFKKIEAFAKVVLDFCDDTRPSNAGGPKVKNCFRKVWPPHLCKSKRYATPISTTWRP